MTDRRVWLEGLPQLLMGGIRVADKNLLIVDDRPDVGRAMKRCFKNDFLAVHIALTPSEAEAILDQMAGIPTYLICDYYLGDNQPLGTDLVPKWRRCFPSIQKAIVLSGSELMNMPTGPGIDAIFKKPADIATLREFFGLTTARALSG